jgi:hypothetical protein
MPLLSIFRFHKGCRLRHLVAWLCLGVVVFTSATATPRLAPFRHAVPGPATIVALQAEAGVQQQRTGTPGSCVLKAFVGVLPEDFGNIERRKAEATRYALSDHSGRPQCGAATLMRPPCAVA